MAPISAAEFAAVLRAADADTVAGFVADLYEARGRSVERDGGNAFVLVGDDPERVVVPADGSVPVDGDADAVVVADRSDDPVSDPETLEIDTDALRNALLYAIDREDADRLLRRWFDRPLSSFEGDPAPGDRGRITLTVDTSGGTSAPERSDRPPDGREGAIAPDDRGNAAHLSGGENAVRPSEAAHHAHRSDEGGDGAGTTTTDTRRPVAAVAAGVVVLVVALAVVGWAAGTSPAFGYGNATSVAPGTATPLTPAHVGEGREPSPTVGGGIGPARGGTPAAGTAEPSLPNPSSEELTGPRGTTSTFPPGIDRSGITDYRRLVAAHRTQLRNRSYRATLVYREFAGDSVTGVSIQTVRVESPTRYHASTSRFGSFRSRPPRLVDADAFADGTVRYERTDTGVRQEPVTGTDPFLDDLSQYLRWYLSVEESWIAGQETRGTSTTVRVESEGDPWPGVTNATGDALVTDAGLVRVVRRAYDDPESGVHAVVTVRVSDVNRTTASAPGWVPGT